MASTVAIPHFINYPGAIPGTIPGPLPGPMPPVTVPVSPPYHHGNIPVTNGNGVIPVVPVGGGCYNDGMEVVWHGEFSRLFSNFYPPHVWYLTITNQAPQHKWKFHRDSAKVRFCCQDCGNGWTSMKGRVTFWFYLDVDNNAGFVQFKLYGQQCKKCNSGKFEYVMWYPEEVSKVMCNVYNKVGQTYYGFLQPPIRIDRRPGRPRNQHNAELCQACRDGECDQARPIKPMFNINGMIHAPLSVPAPPVANLEPQVPISYPSSQSPSNPPRSGASPVVIINSQPTSNGVQNGEHANKPTLIVPANNGSIITTPVTLTAGMQPVLTYSVMSAPPKSTPLSVTSTHFIPNGAPPPPVTGHHYVYHPNPHQLVSGGMPIHPPAVYPVMQAKPPVKSEVKQAAQPANNCASAPNKSIVIVAPEKGQVVGKCVTPTTVQVNGCQAPKENDIAESIEVKKEQVKNEPLTNGVTEETE